MMLRKVRRVARMPLQSLLLRAEAVAWLCLARVALRVVPFPRLIARVGTLQVPAGGDPMSTPSAAALARAVAQAVNASARHLPVEMVCLPRALAAWQMLHLRGSSARLHFGKPRNPQLPRDTHAWLSSAGVEVTGYPVAHDCVEVGYFARVAARERCGS